MDSKSLKRQEDTKKEQSDNSALNIESQKIALTLSKKNIEISFLKRQVAEKLQYIAAIQSELFSLKQFYSDSSKLKQELERATEKNEQQEKEIENLKQKIIDQHKEFTEEKRIEEKKHLTEISKLKVTIDSYIQKTLRSNMNELDNEKLNIQLSQLQKLNEDLIQKSEQDIIQKEVQNKIRLTKLKDKMIENINMTKEQITELNMQYMDVSTKLTLLQNHQLLVQLDYQSQQLDESIKKIELLEKRIFSLNKDLELHKEVEIAFAEKNKKLKEELKRYKKEENKDIKLSEENGGNNKSIGDTNNQQSSNISLLTNNSNGNKKNNNDFNRIINLEKKVISLEKKLEHKKKEYNDLKDKNEHIEYMIKTHDKKYSGLYFFLEESLNNFFADPDMLKNKEIHINNESLKKFEFNNLTKQEKYSTLIILMKYLMPLIYSGNEILNNNNLNDKFAIKYHFPKENKLIINDKFKNIIQKKQLLRNSSNDSVHKINLFKGSGRNSSDTLPSILRGASFRKINTKMPTSGSAISSTTVNISYKN